MRRVTARLALAHRLVVSNVWLLDHAGKRFLVDSGHPLERATLRWQLARAGVRARGDLDFVLLTHRHSDHAGNAEWLRRTFGARILCHEADADCLAGRAKPPRMLPGARWPHERLLCAIEDRFPAVCEVDEALGDGQLAHGFRVVHVPGHTDGSMMLHHEPTGTLFAGDAILAGIPPLRLFEFPRLAVAGFSSDVERCRARVREFVALLPPTETLCSGHGPPITREVGRKLSRLVTGKAGWRPA